MTEDTQALLERSNKAVEMLMRLEGPPYFSGGRGPSPVHELRSVIEALSSALTAVERERDRVSKLVRTVVDQLREHDTIDTDDWQDMLRTALSAQKDAF